MPRPTLVDQTALSLGTPRRCQLGESLKVHRDLDDPAATRAVQSLVLGDNPSQLRIENPGFGTNVASLVVNLTMWLGTAIVARNLMAHVGLAGDLAVVFAASFLIGGRAVAIANVLHAQAHASNFGKRRERHWYVRFVSHTSAIVTATTFIRYCVVHRLHHGFLGDSRDPKVTAYRSVGVLPPPRSKLVLAWRSLLGPAFGKGVLAWFVGVAWPKPFERRGAADGKVDVRNARRQRYVTLGSWALLLAVGFVTSSATTIALFGVLPLAHGRTTIRGFLDVINHCGMIDNVGNSLGQTRSFTLPWWQRYLLGGDPVLGFRSDDFAHGVHHPFPRIPPKNEHQALLILRRSANFRQFNEVCAGLFFGKSSAFGHILRGWPT